MLLATTFSAAFAANPIGMLIILGILFLFAAWLVIKLWIPISIILCIGLTVGVGWLGMALTGIPLVAVIAAAVIGLPAALILFGCMAH